MDCLLRWNEYEHSAHVAQSLVSWLYLRMSCLFWWYGMVWYGIVNVDLYSAIITKVSNALSLCWLHVFCRQLAEKYSMEIPRSQVRSTADTHWFHDYLVDTLHAAVVHFEPCFTSAVMTVVIPLWTLGSIACCCFIVTTSTVKVKVNGV